MPEAFPQELFALLGMAEFGQPGEPESLIPKITQEACRHDRDNALPRQLLYEPLSATMPTRGAPCEATLPTSTAKKRRGAEAANPPHACI